MTRGYGLRYLADMMMSQRQRTQGVSSAHHRVERNQLGRSPAVHTFHPEIHHLAFSDILRSFLEQLLK